MQRRKARYKRNRLQQLRGFCHAASTGSMSRAAEAMYLSQPTVSLQIQALERELGTQLFERRGPRIELTPDGQTLLELAQPLVDGIDRLDEMFTQRRLAPDRGTVAVAAGGSTIQYILPPYVERFARSHPEVDLRLFNVTGKAGLALLRAGEVDLAVGPLLERPPDITLYPLFEFEPCLITCHDHPLARRQRVTLRDISRYPLILPPKDQSTYRYVEAAFAERSLAHDVKLEVGGYDVIKEYVRRNVGVSIVMSHCLTPKDRLHVLPLGRYFPKRHYGVVLRKGRTLSRAAQHFIQTLWPDWTPAVGQRAPHRKPKSPESDARRAD